MSEFLRIDWKTVGRLVELVWRDLEPDPAARFGGLVRIGIDEVSFRKGHRYITTVVNHDTNTVVWACEGFGKEVLAKFFKTQRGRLAVIQAQDGPLARAYAMKEQLRTVFKMSDAKAAGECLDKKLALARVLLARVVHTIFPRIRQRRRYAEANGM